LALEGAPWYNVANLGRAIRGIRGINFSIVEQRDEALARLNAILNEAPYAIDTRFPIGAAYVCEAIGDWPVKLTQLRESLAYRERIKDEKEKRNDKQETKMMVNKNAGAGAMVNFGDDRSFDKSWDFNDSLHAFYKSTQNILSEIGNYDRVFTRENFEEEYGLEWHGSGGPGEPDEPGKPEKKRYAHTKQGLIEALERSGAPKDEIVEWNICVNPYFCGSRLDCEAVPIKDLPERFTTITKYLEIDYLDGKALIDVDCPANIYTQVPIRTIRSERPGSRASHRTE